MSRVVLIRSAAARRARGQQLDAARALSDEGITSVEALRRHLARLSFDLILHSPALRAVQTAEGLVPLLHGRTEVTDRLSQTPDADLITLIDGQTCAVVGHAPWIGQLGCLLASGRGDDEVLDLQPGGLVVLSGEPVVQGMRVVELINPSSPTSAILRA